ncbi:hypothetical protein N2603_05475 [Bradyrhizobium huanghuaihaiense]|uniref:hypothetical protein n=1 Tax=Bradyrhizobium huanghuaihaiense TaxID=990078 RepID=UPI0021A9ECAB|nr:hypothetical protein [Bradyrhizobium sp. CB3035]UWU77913.1 hypothetical protein N2603_05475 [Bradyrhizobium sp. CB3035]
MSKVPSRPTGRLLDRLPPEPRQHLLLIGSEGRGVFGAACFQSIFEAHISLFEYLAAAGATAVMIGRLLAEVGVTRKDGTPLPPGTVSSALSRARERAARAPAMRQSPTGTGTDMPVAADPCNALQANVAVGRATIPMSLNTLPVQDAPVSPRATSSLRPSPNGSPAGLDLPADTRRAAALLAHLRSLNDEDA